MAPHKEALPRLGREHPDSRVPVLRVPGTGHGHLRIGVASWFVTPHEGRSVGLQMFPSAHIF
jgi:hypothetical protein